MVHLNCPVIIIPIPLDDYTWCLFISTVTNQKSSLCLPSCYFRWDCRSVFCLLSPPCSTTSVFFWSALSHWLSWHTQTETLLMSLKAFSSPLVLLEATKHQLSWPVSYLSTCHTPSSHSLCPSQLTDILIFPLLYLSSLHLHFFCSHFHSGLLSCFPNLTHSLLLRPLCSILSQTDWWTIRLWIRLPFCLYTYYCVCL